MMCLQSWGGERTRGTLSENVRYALPEEGSEGKKGESTQVTATEESGKKSKKKKAKKGGYYMSPGKLRADVANKIHKKAYSKKDAAEALNQLTGAGLLSKDTYSHTFFFFSNRRTWRSCATTEHSTPKPR